MKLREILFVAAVLFSSSAQGQLFPKSTEKEDLIEKLPFDKKLLAAKDLFRNGSFYNAEKYFAQLRQVQPRNPYINFMLAETYERNRDYQPAAKFYREAYELAPALYPEAPYREGLMLKSNGQYNEAIERFNFFIQNYKGKNKKMKVYAQRQIEGCNLAIQSLANPEPVFIKNAGPNVNSAYTESSPMPLGDTALAFATIPSNALIDDKAKRSDIVSRILWSPKEYDRTNIKDSFEVALPYQDGKFNDPKYHVGNSCLSPGGDRFYYTKCYEQDTMNMQCAIYVSKFDTNKGKWGPSRKMTELNTDGEFSNTNPYIALVGKKEVLFFSSNRKQGSSGGFDIYYSVYDPRGEGVYRRPQNVGKKVNTNRDEITPYYDSRTGKLYWSSNGLVSMGGFDIFSAEGGPSRYVNVKNLGAPYNSPADDLYYVEDPGAKGNAYIVSNRLGSIYVKNPTCCDDIWRVIKNVNTAIEGRVLDAKTGDPINRVVVKLIDEATGKVVDTFFSANGAYRFNTTIGKNYLLTADKEGYVSGRGKATTMNLTAADPDRVDIVDISTNRITKEYTFNVNNVYFDFNKDVFQQGSEVHLDSLAMFLKDNPSLIVEVYANTDGIGKDASNDELSLRRAERVVTYLSAMGVERSRMIARPQGERVKARPEEVTSEGADNPENRQFNRRVYFRIVGDLEGVRINYNENRPAYIDKTGAEKRNRDLQVKENEEADQGPLQN